MQEQLIEVGRWIGSVFYGMIGKVLPYINGFVMAIKELVKTFALFVGFEIPNSSGQTGTILDSYGDSMEDLNSGIADTNSGLDGAKKKAKELKGSLSGFDKLNIISKPKDDSSGSSGNKPSGGMSIDPKILDALNKYKYLFEDIHMKAQDIRDELLKWADIAKKSFNDNIFRPIMNSWNKYGESVEKNFKSAFGDMKYLASNIFNVVAEKWRPFFQSASDLFYSLLDTASLVLSSVTDFLKRVWDSGGKYFLEGILDLATAFLRLATAINDDFVKPTVRLFKNTLGVAISSVLGVVLGLIGQFMTALSKFITWISKSESAVKLLGTAIVGVFTVTTIGRITKLWNSFEDGTTIATKLFLILSDKSSIIRGLVTKFENSRIKFNSLEEAWSTGVDMIKKLIKGFGDKIKSLKLTNTALANTTGTTEGLTIAQKLCAVATNALQTALTFLGNHPLVALVIGIGSVVTALALLDSQAGDTTKKIEDCSQEIQDQAQEVRDLKDAVDSAVKSSKEQISSTEAQISMAESYINKLKKMQDEDGYVKNINQAKFLIEEINKVLPNTFEITKDGKVIQKQSNDELQKSIGLTIKQAEVRAYQEVYVESLKNQIQAEQKVNDQKKKLIDLEIQQSVAFEEYKREHGKYNMTLEEYSKIQTVLNEQIKEQSSLVNDAEGNLESISNTTEEYGEKLDGLTDSLGKTSEKTIKLSEGTKKAFESIGKNGKKNINDIIGVLKSYDQKIKDTEGKVDESSKNELKSTKQLRDLKVVEYAKMVRDHKLTYEQIIDNAQANGVELSLAEKGTIAGIVEIYKKGGADAGDKYVDDLSTQITKGSYKISDSAKGNVLDTNEILKNVPVEYRSYVEEAISKARQRQQEAQNGVGTIKFGIRIDSNAYKTGKDFANTLKRGLESVTIGVGSVVNGVASGIGKLGFYANGGFPDVGQMFIARERGPELVGTMGGKTAVANNNQIVEGIQSGVYTAMRQVSLESGGKGDIYIKHQTILDGKVIDERIEKVNEEHILKTGKPLFIK